PEGNRQLRGEPSTGSAQDSQLDKYRRRSRSGRTSEAPELCPSPTARLSRANQLVEGARDPKDLVDDPGSGLDPDDEEIAGDAGSLRLGRDRREAEAPGRVVVGEAGERDTSAVLREHEDLWPVAVGNEQMAARTHADRGHHGSAVHDARRPRGVDPNDLARPLLKRSLGSAVAGDPDLAPVVGGEQAGPGHGE